MSSNPEFEESKNGSPRLQPTWGNRRPGEKAKRGGDQPSSRSPANDLFVYPSNDEFRFDPRLRFRTNERAHVTCQDFRSHNILLNGVQITSGGEGKLEEKQAKKIAVTAGIPNVNFDYLYHKLSGFFAGMATAFFERMGHPGRSYYGFSFPEHHLPTINFITTKTQAIYFELTCDVVQLNRGANLESKRLDIYCKITGIVENGLVTIDKMITSSQMLTKKFAELSSSLKEYLRKHRKSEDPMQGWLDKQNIWFRDYVVVIEAEHKNAINGIKKYQEDCMDDVRQLVGSMPIFYALSNVPLAIQLFQHIRDAYSIPEYSLGQSAQAQANYRYFLLLTVLLLEPVFESLFSIQNDPEQKEQESGLQQYRLQQQQLLGSLLKDFGFLRFIKHNLQVTTEHVMTDTAQWLSEQKLETRRDIGSPAQRIVTQAEDLAEKFDVSEIKEEKEQEEPAPFNRGGLAAKAKELDIERHNKLLEEEAKARQLALERHNNLLADVNKLLKFVWGCYSRYQNFLLHTEDSDSSYYRETQNKYDLFKELKNTLSTVVEKLNTTDNPSAVLRKSKDIIRLVAIAAHHHASKSLWVRLFSSPTSWSTLKKLNFQIDELNMALKSVTAGYYNFKSRSYACDLFANPVAHFDQLHSEKDNIAAAAVAA